MLTHVLQMGPGAALEGRPSPREGRKQDAGSRASAGAGNAGAEGSRGRRAS